LAPLEPDPLPGCRLKSYCRNRENSKLGPSVSSLLPYLDFLTVKSIIMNKRAKKRLKEAIANDKQEKAKSLPKQRPGSSKDPQQLRGFLPKPDKKRG
jgi:hypothetical protein